MFGKRFFQVCALSCDLVLLLALLWRWGVGWRRGSLVPPSGPVLPGVESCLLAATKTFGAGCWSRVPGPGKEASLIVHPCGPEEAPIPGLECNDWTSWFSKLASGQRDPRFPCEYLFIGRSLGYWFPDPGMRQLHIFFHPPHCFAYLCLCWNALPLVHPWSPWQPSKVLP